MTSSSRSSQVCSVRVCRSSNDHQLRILVTNSSSTTVSASVGFNADGPNVSTGYSVTTGESQTYNVPPTTILNQSNLATAVPVWQFEPQSLTAGADFSVNTTWTWYVPQDAYPLGGSGSSSLGPYGTGEIILSPIRLIFARIRSAALINVSFPQVTTPGAMFPIRSRLGRSIRLSCRASSPRRQKLTAGSSRSPVSIYIRAASPLF